MEQQSFTPRQLDLLTAVESGGGAARTGGTGWLRSPGTDWLPSNLEDQHRLHLVHPGQPGRSLPLAHQLQTIGPPVRHQFLMPAHSPCEVLPECCGSVNLRQLKMREAVSRLVQPVPRRRRQRWSRFRVTAGCRSVLNRRAKWLEYEVSGDLKSATNRAFERVWPHQ